MSNVPDTMAHELTMLLLSQNDDLSKISPEQLKMRYFDILHRIETANVERWD